MAKHSYYKTIKGEKYDRRLLELAEGTSKGKGEGRVSVKDARKIIQASGDGGAVTDIEQNTIRYILNHFNHTAKAKEELEIFLREQELPEYDTTPLNKLTESIRKDEESGTRKDEEGQTLVDYPAGEVVSGKALQRDSGESAWIPGSRYLLALLLVMFFVILFFWLYRAYTGMKSGDGSNARETVSVPGDSNSKGPVQSKATDEPEVEVDDSRTDLEAESRSSSPLGAYTLYFQSNGVWVGSDEHGHLLDRVARKVKENDRKEILHVTGYSDNVGGPKVNLQISRIRAINAAGALKDRGVSEKRMIVEGEGSADPVGDNGTEAGRAKNRRVEFHIQSSSKK